MPGQNIDVILRLLNGRRFQAEMRSAGRATRDLGKEFGSASTATSGLATAGHAASGALYGISAASRVAGYGVGALAAATVGLGIQFNATMEGNTLAFQQFSMSAQEASGYTKELFQIAKETPFGFEDITTTARRLLGAGLSAEQTTEQLRIMGDVLSTIGGNTDQVFRLAKALGDISSAGRLLGPEVRQLSNLGINWRKILDAGGLKLTKKDLESVGRAGITSAEFFKAWSKGSKEVFGGASAKYAQTFNGQMQKLQDNIKIAAGSSTSKAFAPLKNALKSLNEFLDDPEKVKQFSDAFNKYGTMALKIFGGAIALVIGIFDLFMETVAPAQPFFENVLGPLLKGVFVGVVGGIIVAVALLQGFFKVLGWIGSKLGWAKGLFEALGTVIGFVFGGWILQVIGGLTKFGFILGFIGVVARVLAIPIRLVGFALGLLGKMAFFGMKGLVLLPGIAGAIGRAFFRVLGVLKGWGSKMMNFVGGVLSRIIGRIQNVFGLQAATAFADAAVKARNAFVDGLKNLGKLVLKALGSIAGFAASIGGGIKKWINEHTLFGDEIHLFGLTAKIPALAGGGYVSGGGYALVGEKGPEIVKLPASSTVIPNQPANTRALNSSSKRMGDVDVMNAEAATAAEFESNGRPIITKVFIGRRQVAEAVGEEVAHQTARSRGR